jgi:hypothetical protein
MKVRNRITGKEFQFSAKRARLRRVQKRVMSWSEVIKPYTDRVGETTRLVMVTLTYGGSYSWEAGHIRAFMLRIRKDLGLGLLAYAWVAELQERGAVHYHVLLLVKRGTKIEYPDSSGAWPYGLTRIETARSPFYILTYTGKEYQKVGIFPKGLRMFAVWIADGVVSAVTRWFFRLSAIPGWLRDEIKGDLGIVGAKFKRVVGGGWECDGVFYRSPWEVIEYG